MATKVQLESMVYNIIEAQNKGITVFSAIFDPVFIVIITHNGRIIIDTDGVSKWTI